MLEKLKKNKTIINASWLIFGRIFQLLFNLFVTLLSARYLGPSNYGLINYANAYNSFFFSICTLGINSVLVKEFIDNKNQEGKIIGTSLLLRLISGLFSIIIINSLSYILDYGESTTRLVVALSSISILFNIYEVFNYWFQSQLKSKYTALTSLVGVIITGIYKIYLLVSGKSVAYFAFAISIDYIIISILLIIIYFKNKGGKLTVDLKYGKNLLKKSCYYILPGLMVSIYGQTDKLMLKQMISDSEIAFYSAAVSICNVWTFLLSAIIDSVYPSIMTSFKEKDEKGFIYKNKILYILTFYISTIVSVLIVIFSKLIVIILFGKNYLPASLPLKIITWYTAFSYLGVARNAWIVCKNKQKYIKYIYIMAAFVNVFLNFILIPKYGASGAAFASLFAQITTILIAPLFIKNMRENTKLIIEAITFKDIFWKFECGKFKLINQKNIGDEK